MALRVEHRWREITLREVGAELRDAIKEIPDVSVVTLIGGRPRQIMVDVDSARLSALADEALADLDVTSVRSYTGTASPYNFNGLVRH